MYMLHVDTDTDMIRTYTHYYAAVLLAQRLHPLCVLIFATSMGPLPTFCAALLSGLLAMCRKRPMRKGVASGSVVPSATASDASSGVAQSGMQPGMQTRGGGSRSSSKLHQEKKDGAESLARLQDALAALGPLRCSDGGRLARALQPFRDSVGASWTPQMAAAVNKRLQEQVRRRQNCN